MSANCPTQYYVHHITGDQVPVSDGPNPWHACTACSHLVRWVGRGAEIDIVCQAIGGYYAYGSGGSGVGGPYFHVWDRQTDGTWVPDGWVDTPNVNTWSPPIPQC